MSPLSRDRIVIRGGSGQWIVGALTALCLYLLVDAAVRDEWRTVLVAAPWMGASVLICVVLLVRPCMVIGRDSLTVVNPVRTHVLPWREIDELTVRYQLVVVLIDGTRLSAWGSPTTHRPREIGHTQRSEVSPRRLVGVIDVIAQARDELGGDPRRAVVASTRIAWAPFAAIAVCVLLGLLSMLNA